MHIDLCSGGGPSDRRPTCLWTISTLLQGYRTSGEAIDSVGPLD